MFDYHKIVEGTKADGGVSISLVGRVPTKGYMVAMGREEVFASITPADIKQYVDKHIKDLIPTYRYLGTWKHLDLVYLDVSRNIYDRDAAIADAREHGEKAIWDIVNKKEIYT